MECECVLIMEGDILSDVQNKVLIQRDRIEVRDGKSVGVLERERMAVNNNGKTFGMEESGGVFFAERETYNRSVFDAKVRERVSGANVHRSEWCTHNPKQQSQIRMLTSIYSR